jgi:hypothetical protein
MLVCRPTIPMRKNLDTIHRHAFLHAYSTISLNCPSLVIDGGLHEIYDRSMYQAGKVVPSELVMMLDSQLAI